MKLKAILVLVTFFITIVGQAQVAVPGGFFHNLDLFNDSTTLTFHSSVQTENVANAFDVLNPQTQFSINTNYPRGLNDGPVWKGKGLTSEIHAGVQGKIGVVSYTFYPVLYHSQNLQFDLAEQRVNGISPYGYQYGVGGGIDWVQRYGGSSFMAFHPGQSELKLELGKFVTSLSTQNYSVGPSVFNPIILSRQGPGFPHFRLGSNPFDLKIKEINLGKLEANFIVGFLKASDHFDNNEDNNKSYFNALFLAYSPPFLKNATLGINKALYKQTSRYSAQDLLSVITVLDTVGPNDQFDQLASATLEWKFPEVGFRAYAEFAVNDFGGAAKWIEPEHSRAYTIGFEKLTQLKSGDSFVLIYEHTNLSRNHTYLWRAEPTFYVHSVNRQGYTNRGQLLGAGIGPGSNSDMGSLKFFTGKNTFGGCLQRIENNKDYFAVNIRDRFNHHIEYSGGLFYQREFDRYIASAEAIFSRDNNRYYVLSDDHLNVYMSFKFIYKLN
tara:strand:+ start:161 stop:1648 length:1488 start_codon:yes stop_codon:yes gene_type:complete